MANQFFNFYYDPARQGYDTNTWTTLSGAPVVAGSQLSLSSAAIMHFADLLPGDAVFSVNIDAPAAGDDIKFGFSNSLQGSYLYFQIVDDVLTAEISNGITTSSTVIDWDASWTNTNTEFRIKWEAGMATFAIGGVQKACVTDVDAIDKGDDIIIPNDPLSLYISTLGGKALLLNYIIVKSIQSSTLLE